MHNNCVTKVVWLKLTASYLSVMQDMNTKLAMSDSVTNILMQ